MPSSMGRSSEASEAMCTEARRDSSASSSGRSDGPGEGLSAGEGVSGVVPVVPGPRGACAGALTAGGRGVRDQLHLQTQLQLAPGNHPQDRDPAGGARGDI